jgi:putative membrane protein
MFLSDAEANSIDAQIGRLESRTGVQVVTTVVGKSDTYAELPWKAFALGAAIGGLAVVLADAAWPQWVTAHTVLICTTTILGAAATHALLAVFVPPFARLFLRPARRDLEVHQHAQSVFLTRELFRTHDRRGLLLFVSLFERKIEILPDTGFRPLMGEADWEPVIAQMAPLLRDARPFQALERGLSALEDLLVARRFQPDGGLNELPDRPIEERGV